MWSPCSEKAVGQDKARGLDRGQSTSGFGMENERFRFHCKHVVKLSEGLRQRNGMI